MTPGKRNHGRILRILFGFVAVSAANAETQAAPRCDRAGREGVFREMKALESESHRERIRILQESEACIQRSQVFREYRECVRAEAGTGATAGSPSA